MNAAAARKLREWQKVASAPYGTYGKRKTMNARRQLALYASGIGHPSLYVKSVSLGDACTDPACVADDKILRPDAPHVNDYDRTPDDVLPPEVAALRDLSPGMVAVAIEGLSEALKRELPGVTFGYIGNCGVDRSGPFDDRSWYIFLPHPGRVGTYEDRIGGFRTSDLATMLASWEKLANGARVAMRQRGSK